VELFPGAEETLTTLAASSPLMPHHEGRSAPPASKLERSGLLGCFRYVEVVSHKTADVYAAILSRHGVAPERFVMIGNSLRSNVLPVVKPEDGPCTFGPVSWSHEDAEAPAHLRALRRGSGARARS